MATNPERPEQARKYRQVVAKAWADEAFKQRLIADPRAVLSEAGIAAQRSMPTLPFACGSGTWSRLPGSGSAGPAYFAGRYVGGR